MFQQEAVSLPGVGEEESLHAAVMSGQKDKVLGEPYQSDAGWHVVKVVDRTEGKARPFSEVRDAVERDTRAARRSEVTQQYIQELFDAAGVKFYPNAFGIGAADEATHGET